MISIIVSSYNDFHYKNLEQNIADTIGVEYEIIRIINKNRIGTAKAYNQGALKAKNKFLCFLHEDIKIHTNIWGTKLIMQYTENKNSGVLGIAGSKIKTKLPTGWFTMLAQYDELHLIENDLETNTSKKWILPYKKSLVKVLDGVFLFTTRKVWSEFNFNEKINGYHFYDLDFSLNVSKKYSNYVTSKILIEHFSAGNFGDDWVSASIKFHKNNREILNPNNVKLIDDIRKNWYLFLSNHEINLINKFRYIFRMGLDTTSLPAIMTFLHVRKHVMKMAYKCITNFQKMINFIKINRIEFNEDET